MGGGVGIRIFYALRKISKYAKDFFKYLIYAVFFLFVGVLAGLIPFFLPDLRCTEPLLIRRCCRYKLSGRCICWHCYLSYFGNLLHERRVIASYFLAHKTLQNMRERLTEKNASYAHGNNY